jgi:hypothetical protein
LSIDSAPETRCRCTLTDNAEGEDMAQTTNRNGNENYSGRINKYCRDFAESNGHYNYTTYEKANEITGKLEERQMLDPINPFTWNDPNMYVFVLIDNASNLSTEKGMDIWGTINKMSKYAITLKSQLNMIVVLIQHQALRLHNSNNFSTLVLYKLYIYEYRRTNQGNFKGTPHNVIQ